MEATREQNVQRLAEMLLAARRIVAFTGAGISTESGIPDFRSPTGVWAKYEPVMFSDFLTDPDERLRYWKMGKERAGDFLRAEPNAGHRALAKLEFDGRLIGVITQNIDELHQKAGSAKVLEVHGTALKVGCMSCERQWPTTEILERSELGVSELLCEDCGGLLKSMTVSFGQQLPAAVWMEAVALCKKCDLFLAIGSSLVVQPAADLPVRAKAHGAKLVILNRDATPLDEAADLVIHASIGETLSAAIDNRD